MKVLEKEILNAFKTKTGKLYILGTLIGFLVLSFSVGSSAYCLFYDNKKISVENILMSFLLGLVALLQLPYIYDKVLARIVCTYTFLAYFTSLIFYLIAYFKNYKSKHKKKNIHF